MVCPKCNRVLPDNAQFCGSCGTKIAPPQKKISLTGWIVLLSVILVVSLSLFFLGRWENRNTMRMLGFVPVLEMPEEWEEPATEDTAAAVETMPVEVPATREPIEEEPMALYNLNVAMLFSDGSQENVRPMEYIMESVTPYIGNMDIHDPGGDPWGQIEVANMLIASGYDMLIVRPVNTDAMVEIAHSCGAAGVPVVFVYTSDLPELQEIHYGAAIVDGTDYWGVGETTLYVMELLVTEGTAPRYTLCGEPTNGITQPEVETPHYEPAGGEPYIAMLMDNGATDVTKEGAEYLLMLTEEHGYYCDFVSFTDSVETQVAELFEMLENGHNVIFLDAVDPEAVAEMTEICRSYGATLILLNCYDGDIGDYELAASVFVESGGYTLASVGITAMEELFYGGITGPVYYNY